MTSPAALSQLNHLFDMLGKNTQNAPKEVQDFFKDELVTCQACGAMAQRQIDGTVRRHTRHIEGNRIATCYGKVTADVES